VWGHCQHIRRWISFLLLVASACLSSVSAADSLLGWSITPAVGVRLVDLNVTRNSDGFTGTITNDGSFFGPMYAAINVESPTFLLSDRVGVTVRAHASEVSLSNQRVRGSGAPQQEEEEIKDLGTKVSGYYSYLMPTIFYRTVDRGGDSRFGLGAGRWKAWFSGDIILAPNGAATVGMPKTPIEGSMEGRTGWYLFWQGRWPKGLFEISISNVRLKTSNFKYEMQEINMMFGYHMEF